MSFVVYLSSSETFEQTTKRKFALALKNRLTSGEIVSPYVIGHEMSSSMSAHESRNLSKEVSKTSKAENKLFKNKIEG